MQISLLRISLLRFFKTITKNLPNATFGSGKKSHQPKIALAKFLLYVQSNKINSPKNGSSQILVIALKNRSNEICSNEICIRRELPVLTMSWLDIFLTFNQLYSPDARGQKTFFSHGNIYFYEKFSKVGYTLVKLQKFLALPKTTTSAQTVEKK